MRTYPPYTPTRLYTLTAADGWTTCCDGTLPCLRIEAARTSHPAPFTVADWVRTTEPTAHGGWRKVGEFVFWREPRD